MPPSRVLLASAIALVLVACGGGASTSTASNALSGTPIKVGVIIPLTGTQAALGQDFKDGAQAGADYVNAHGGALGRPITLVFRDSAGQPTNSAAAIRDLGQSGVVAILGDNLSADYIAETPVFNQLHLPSFSTSTVNSIWAPGANPYAFSVGETSDMTAQVDTQYLVKVKNLTKIGVIYESGTFGKTASDASTAILSTYGLKPVGAQSFQTGSTDVSPQLQALKAAGAEGLLVWTFGPGLANVARSLQAIGWEPPAATVVGLGDQAVVKAAGAGALANFYGGPTVKRFLVAKQGDRPSYPKMQDFLTYFGKVRGVSTFNGEQLNAGTEFDKVLILSEAIKIAKSTDGVAVKNALETTAAGFDGARATYHYTADKHVGETLADVGLYQGGVACTAGCVAAPGILGG